MPSISEAVKDAAIANINEDLYEINKQIEALPEGLQQYVAEFKTSITHMGESLEKALEAVPETFDHNITDNLAKAVETAEAIEQSTHEFNELIKHQQLNLNQHANTISELHKRELDAMKSEHQKAMRLYTAEQRQLLEKAVEAATSRSNQAIKNSETACDKLISKFDDSCVVPLLWICMLPIVGGVIGALIMTFAQTTSKYFL
ncbi:TPA: hypothetical protein ACVU43_004241 [Vibrio parahaemolyticus]|nr:hypothetical protein [Vibrio parahaemolyticus]HBC3831134.1 hypothetical protein [Vibrio parahaemolyticus]